MWIYYLYSYIICAVYIYSPPVNCLALLMLPSGKKATVGDRKVRLPSHGLVFNAFRSPSALTVEHHYNKMIIVPVLQSTYSSWSVLVWMFSLQVQFDQLYIEVWQTQVNAYGQLCGDSMAPK